ncbi:MAG: RDD family protein [Oligosphaeraceae bacterium]|nr:RDD family protein [Oligosphaeraceae bacterium]
MANERSYIVKLESGEEFGPVEQEVLVRYAETGRINYQTKVRSVLVPRWEKAVNLPFLKAILQSQLEQALLSEKLSLWGRIMRRATLKVDATASTGSLVQVKAENFERAKLLPRILAALFDLLLLFAGSLLLTTFCYVLLKMQILTSYNAAYVLLLLCFAWLLGYYILLITLQVQTPGQKFWGIFLVRLSGEKFYYGRVFCYTLLLLLFGVFTPFHILISPSGRSWQEILTGTKMVKTKLADNRKIR